MSSEQPGRHSVRIPPLQNEQLKALAKEKDVPVATFIAQIVKEYLQPTDGVNHAIAAEQHVIPNQPLEDFEAFERRFLDRVEAMEQRLTTKMEGVAKSAEATAVIGPKLQLTLSSHYRLSEEIQSLIEYLLEIAEYLAMNESYKPMNAEQIALQKQYKDKAILEEVSS